MRYLYIYCIYLWKDIISVCLSREVNDFIWCVYSKCEYIYRAVGVLVSSVGGGHGHGHIVLGLGGVGQLLISGPPPTPAVVDPSLLVAACGQVSIVQMSIIIPVWTWSHLFICLSFPIPRLKHFWLRIVIKMQRTWRRWSSPRRSSLLLLVSNQLLQLVNLHQSMSTWKTVRLRFNAGGESSVWQVGISHISAWMAHLDTP